MNEDTFIITWKRYFVSPNNRGIIFEVIIDRMKSYPHNYDFLSMLLVNNRIIFEIYSHYNGLHEINDDNGLSNLTNYRKPAKHYSFSRSIIIYKRLHK